MTQAITSLVNQDIKNLVAGISQQPQVLRHAEQLEEQINALSSETGGLQKRPPTLHISKLLETISPTIKPLAHFIKRDANEEYCLVFNGTGVAVYDLAGNKKTVTYEGMAQTYISSLTPRTELKCITIADYTFVANVNKTVAMVADTGLDYYALQGALVNVKSGQYGRTYKVIINDVEKASFTTPDGSQAAHTAQIDTNYIAGQLASQLTTAGYTIEQAEGWIHIDSQGITSIKTKDGYNNQAMFGILKSVQKFTSLPATAPNNFVARVAGEPSSYSDDYYVQYTTAAEVWKETVKPKIANTIDGMTMPCVIIRNSDGSFTVKQATWVDRKAGDEDSNPLPSFIGQKIKDIFFFRNRLGVVAGENVILSKSADYFDFWMSSAVEVLDTDPIDLPISDNKVATIYHAVPFAEDLLLFTADAQFALRAEGAMTPKTAKIDSLTNFNTSLTTKPVGAGKNTYFIAERSQYSTVKEFFTSQTDSMQKDAQDITAHVPSLIPNGVHKIVSSTVENVLLFLTEGEPNKIYVYKYLFLDGVRQQASWSVWDMGAKVIGAEFINAQLYILMERGSYYYLEKMTFAYNTTDFADEPYRVLLDRKVITAALGESAYNEVDNTTTLDISAYYNPASELPLVPYGIITEDGVYTLLYPGVTEVALIGNFVGKKVIIGQVYECKIVFSQIMIKKVETTGTTSVTEGRLQLQKFWLNYANSGYFKATVKHIDKGYTYVYEHTGNVLDSNTLLDSLSFDSGKFIFPIQTQNTKCSIEITTSAPSPISLVGAGWMGNYLRKARSI